MSLSDIDPLALPANEFWFECALEASIIEARALAELSRLRHRTGRFGTKGRNDTPVESLLRRLAILERVEGMEAWKRQEDWDRAKRACVAEAVTELCK